MIKNKETAVLAKTQFFASTQYFSSISANLIMVGYGCAIGWLSMALPLLKSDDSPLDTGALSVSDVSWIGSSVSLGALTGNFICGFIVTIIGARHTIFMIGFPQLLSWLFMTFGTCPFHLMISRFLSGTVVGGAQTCVFLYIAEVADNEIRGQLGTIYMYARNFGILIAFTIGSYYNYITASLLFTGITVTFLATFLFVPSTPQHFLQKNDIRAAEESFKFYHKHRLQTEPKYCAVHFERLKDVANDVKSHSKISWKDIKNSRHGMMQAMVFSLLNILTGQFIFLSYGSDIIAKSGTHLPPGASSIFMALVQLVATFVTYILIDKKGRKFLLIVSLVGCSLSHAIMVAYIYLNSHGVHIALLHWTPILCMASVIFMASIGIVPLTFICMAESFPSKMRPFGMTFGNVVLNVISFVVMKMYPILQQSIGLPTCLMLFGGSCALGTIYVTISVEETKGKELNEATESTEMTSSRNELYTTH